MFYVFYVLIKSNIIIWRIFTKVTMIMKNKIIMMNLEVNNKVKEYLKRINYYHLKKVIKKAKKILVHNF